MLKNIATSFGKVFAASYFAISAALAAPSWVGPTNDSSWEKLKSELAEAEKQLASTIAKAEQAHLATDRAKVSLTVLKTFQTFAEFDRKHPEITKEKMNDAWWKDKIPVDYEKNLPFEELSDCLEVAQFAIDELNAQLSKKTTVLPAPDLQSGPILFEQANCTLNGKPVFPSTFNWLPPDPDLIDAFGNIGTVFLSPAQLRKSGQVQAYAQRKRSEHISRLQSLPVNPIALFIGHNLSQWMKQDHPESTKGQRHFTRCDVDSPLVRSWYSKILEQTLPPIISAIANTSRLYLLANEPHFSIREKGWLASNGVSEHTNTKYETWLKSRYRNDIKTLNRTYGTSHSNFTEARLATTVPIPLNLRGGPIWYDYCRFNMDRINGWFDFLNSQVKSQDPAGGLSSIKILGGSLLDSWHDGGIDLEYLFDLQDVMGSDLTTIPHNFINLNIKDSLDWTERYCIEWVEQSIVLDFAKSLYPHKTFYDSEWHGLDAKWKNYHLERDYIRAALWLSFSHGMNMMQAWVWSRDIEGRPVNKDCVFVGEIITQPTALDAFGRTIKELNAHAYDVSNLVPEKRPFRIFYSEESAIQAIDYTHGLSTTYEAMKMLNLPLGFATGSTLSSLSENHILVIPTTPYLSDKNFQKP